MVTDLYKSDFILVSFRWNKVKFLPFGFTVKCIVYKVPMVARFKMITNNAMLKRWGQDYVNPLYLLTSEHIALGDFWSRAAA